MSTESKYFMKVQGLQDTQWLARNAASATGHHYYTKVCCALICNTIINKDTIVTSLPNVQLVF